MRGDVSRRCGMKMMKTKQELLLAEFHPNVAAKPFQSQIYSRAKTRLPGAGEGGGARGGSCSDEKTSFSSGDHRLCCSSAPVLLQQENK